MSAPFVVHGEAGSGSVAVEAALTLLALPYEVREGPSANNAMAQVPSLILPSGELMTESAAILIWLADGFPAAGLAPALDDPRRSAFLRWMVFISSAIYSHFWARDDPLRLAADAAAVVVVRERTAARIYACWAVMEAQVRPAPYVLGDTIGVLDIYVTVVSRWAQRRRRFYEAAPQLGEVARRVDRDPRLADFWARRFPFEPGWEG